MMTKGAPGIGSSLLANRWRCHVGWSWRTGSWRPPWVRGWQARAPRTWHPPWSGCTKRWADGGAGSLITGVISVQRGAADASLVCLDSRTDTGALAEWAAAVHSRDVRLIGQLVHQGRQTTTKPVTTTAIRNRDHGEAWPARVVV